MNSTFDSIRSDGNQIILNHIDLAGASFQQTHFVSSDLSNAIMVKAVFDRTEFGRVDLSGADLTDAVYYNATFQHVTATGMISDDHCLNQVIAQSVFRRERLTTDPVVSDAMQDYLKTHPDSSSKGIVVLMGQFTSDDARAMYRLFIHP